MLSDYIHKTIQQVLMEQVTIWYITCPEFFQSRLEAALAHLEGISIVADDVLVHG